MGTFTTTSTTTRRRRARLAVAALAVAAAAVGGLGAAPAHARKAPKPTDGAVLPAAPRDVQTVAHDGAVWVSWAVSEAERAANRRYVVTEVSTGRQKKRDATVWDAPRAGLLFRGLTNGVEYRFTVRAMNPYLGPPSAAVPGTPSRTVRVVGETWLRNENQHLPAAFPFTLRLSSPAPVDVDLHVVTTDDGTATPGVDFEPLDAVVTVPAGQLTAPVSIAMIDDDEPEFDGFPETIGVRAEGVVPGTAAWALGPDPQLLQLEDVDDAIGRFDVILEGGASVPEGDDGWAVLPFTLRLTKPATRDVTFGVRPYGQRAFGYAMADIDGTSFTVTVPKGATTVPVPVRVRGDRAVEPDLTVGVWVRTWAGEFGQLSATAEGTVRDDDGDTPRRGSDLVVEAKTRGTQVRAGRLPETTIRVRNHGDEPAQDVVFGLEQSDLRVATAAVTASTGTCTAKDPIGDLDEVVNAGAYPTRVHTCELVTLDPGEEVTVQLAGRAFRYGSWRWTAWATSADGTDPNKNDNVDFADYLVPDPSGPQPEPWPTPDPIATGGKPDTEDTYRSVPTPPRDVQALGLRGWVRVSWLPPAEDNNREVNFYRVTDLVTHDVILVKDLRSDAQGRFFTFLRRDNGNAVQVAVEAVNNVGRSRPSDPSPVTRARAEAELGEPVAVHESAGLPARASAPVTVHGTSSSWTTLRVRTTDAGTATPGEDFAPLDTTLQVPPHDGSWTGQVSVTLLDDHAVEDDETIGLRLEATDTVAVVESYDPGPPSLDDEQPAFVDTLLPVLDDDAEPILTVLGAEDVVEVDRGQVNLVYPVVLSKASHEPVTVTFWGGAGTPDADGARHQAAVRYDGRVRTVVIPAGERSAEVFVPVFGDVSVNPDLSVPVRVAASAGVTVGTDVAWGLVRDDDDARAAGPNLRVRVTKPQVTEGGVAVEARVRNQSDAESASVGVRVVVAKADGLTGLAVTPARGAGTCKALDDAAAAPWWVWQCTLPKLAGDADAAIRVTGRLADDHGEVSVAAATRSEPLADVDLRDNVAFVRLPASGD